MSGSVPKKPGKVWLLYTSFSAKPSVLLRGPLECPLPEREDEALTPTGDLSAELGPRDLCKPTRSLSSSDHDNMDARTWSISNLLESARGVLKNEIRTFVTSRLEEGSMNKMILGLL